MHSNGQDTLSAAVIVAMVGIVALTYSSLYDTKFRPPEPRGVTVTQDPHTEERHSPLACQYCPGNIAVKTYPGSAPLQFSDNLKLRRDLLPQKNYIVRGVRRE